uniref:Uncharacterized protein n=1 Tax=Fagus sylvatica TaxID=28930 RepID=A0A2N9EWR8_FAGSY
MAMALSSAFRERLEHMDHTRNQRLSLLPEIPNFVNLCSLRRKCVQVERELQASKSHVLVTKHANIRAMEQRCLLLEQKIASQNFKISALKFEIERLDAKYCTDSQHLRVLKSEVEELGELEKERDRFYELKSCEMKEFKENVENFVAECQMCVEELRNGIKEVMSKAINLHLH